MVAHSDPVACYGGIDPDPLVMQVIPDILSVIFEGGFDRKEFKQAGCLRCDGMADFVDAGLAGDVVDEFKFHGAQDGLLEHLCLIDNVLVFVCHEKSLFQDLFVPAGQNVLLMDSESSCFYIKSTDNAGMPLPLRIFDYTERKQETNAIFQNSENNAQTEFIAREEFEKKFGEIETELRKLKTMTKEKKNVKSSV